MLECVFLLRFASFLADMFVGFLFCDGFLGELEIYMCKLVVVFMVMMVVNLLFS